MASVADEGLVLASAEPARAVARVPTFKTKEQLVSARSRSHATGGVLL